MDGNYIAIAEPSMDNHSWWITFLALPGVVIAADSPGEIALRAGDALVAAVEVGAVLPAARCPSGRAITPGVDPATPSRWSGS